MENARLRLLVVSENEPVSAANEWVFKYEITSE